MADIFNQPHKSWSELADIAKNLYKSFGNNPRNQELADALLNVSGATPGVGDVQAGVMAANDLKNKKYASALLNGIGALPLIPALGNITAWHGSPHIFEKFDIDKSGSGSGNDFGFGNYLSESPSVATKYMGDEEKFITTVGGKEMDTPVLKSILRAGGNPDDYIKSLSKKLEEQNKALLSANKKEILPGISDYDIAKLDYNSTLNKINEAKSYIGKEIKNKREGNLYKVDLPDEHLPYFINWDATQQTPEVISILKQHGIYQPNKTGQDLYFNAIEKAENSNAEKSGFQNASEYLNSIGIKGNKYTDRTYGTVAKNPTNYVVFDPNTIKILERK